MWTSRYPTWITSAIELRENDDTGHIHVPAILIIISQHYHHLYGHYIHHYRLYNLLSYSLVGRKNQFRGICKCNGNQRPARWYDKALWQFATHKSRRNNMAEKRVNNYVQCGQKVTVSYLSGMESNYWWFARTTVLNLPARMRKKNYVKIIFYEKKERIFSILN
jgi:hypothetical protein